jgi:hypothetical protein
VRKDVLGKAGMADIVEQNGYPSIEPIEVSDEELREEIAREAEARLDMTYEEFVEAYREGTLPDTLAVNDLVILLRFLELSGGIPA